MSRYICVDGVETLIELEEAPGIDICFCKDCSYRNEINCPQYYRRTELRDDDFCSYGQKGDENVETD